MVEALRISRYCICILCGRHNHVGGTITTVSVSVLLLLRYVFPVQD